MRYRHTFLAILVGLGFATSPHAAILTEDFEAVFPSWESAWFGVNSNAKNLYEFNGQGNAFRGNNPDGLWVVDAISPNGPAINVTFDAAFANTLLALKIDVAAHAPTTLVAWDKDNNLVFSAQVTPTSGALTDPGTYITYSITSSNGIRGFTFTGSSRGNTSIDNLVAEVSSIPEPETYVLFVSGLLLIRSIARNRR